MKFSRILGVTCFGVLFLPFLLVHGQQGNEPRDEARKFLKPLRAKLMGAKTAKETLESLKTLEEVAEELHQGMRFGLAQALMHRDPAVRRQAAITIGAIGIQSD